MKPTHSLPRKLLNKIKITRKQHFIKLVITAMIILCCFSFSSTYAQLRWDSLAPRINHFGNEGPNVMYADSNYLYMAGKFKTIDGKHIQGIAKWNGIKWDSLGAGIDGLEYDSLPSEYPENTWAITNYNGKLYIGGTFSSLGYIQTPRIGTWDGSVWDSLSIQPFKANSDYSVRALAIINNNLYMGGEFDTIAGLPCNEIAKWNGSNWSNLNFPTLIAPFGIDAICEYEGSIYVGGNFCNTLGDTISNILRWNGTNWLSVGGGIKGGDVSCMAVYKGELYVGGYFFKGAGNACDYIQRWNGTEWRGVGGGTGGANGEIWQLLVRNNKLYALGEFQTAGGVNANEVASWDSTQWCSYGGTFDNTIFTGCIYKDSLYIGGGFRTIDGDSIVYVAEWTGGNYVDSCGAITTGVNEIQPNAMTVTLYPNPSNGKFTLSLQGVPEKTQITVFNILGEQVYQSSINASNTEIDLSGKADGIYMYRVVTEAGSLVSQGKVVKQ